jgi:hypothetical protein
LPPASVQVEAAVNLEAKIFWRRCRSRCNSFVLEMTVLTTRRPEAVMTNHPEGMRILAEQRQADLINRDQLPAETPSPGGIRPAPA